MSSLAFKISAIFFMLIDHIGMTFFPKSLLLRTIGRLSMPLFAFQFAIGMHNTSNIRKRIFKLIIFAILVQVPYMLLLKELKGVYNLNIIFTFIFSAIIILLINNAKQSGKFSYYFITSIMVLIMLNIINIFNVDYGLYGVLITIMFYYTLNHKILMPVLFFTLLVINGVTNPSFYTVSAFLTLIEIPLFLAYNGKKGYKHGSIFYLIYFVHFIALLYVKIAIG